VRRVVVVTFGRSDYSSGMPIMRALQQTAGLDLGVVVSGMHLSARFGRTVTFVEADGFPIVDRLELIAADDSAAASAVAVGEGTVRFARSLSRLVPDLLLLVVDRAELLAPAIAALELRIPVAHISGGDVTEGAIDNQVRHAVSKLSHLHFVALPEHAARLRQMGEEPWRITVSGDPALDLVETLPRLDRAAVAVALGVTLQRPVILLSHHPTTLGAADPAREIDALMNAVADFPGTFIATAPNSDHGYSAIEARLEQFASRPNVRLVTSLGQQLYFSLLAQADAMVGNSSSAIWEAPSFRLPAVDVGDRQKGRACTANVIHTPADTGAIRSALGRALTPDFRNGLRQLQNPYGDGHSTARIVSVLSQVDLGPALLQKRFVDLLTSGTA